jgi:hypothetical protein
MHKYLWRHKLSLLRETPWAESATPELHFEFQNMDPGESFALMTDPARWLTHEAARKSST